RGKGMGRKLMEQVEAFSKKMRAHKIYLFTGKNWNAGRFYETLGYKKTADLPKHFFEVDFVIYSKML
ncbi:MAG: GNAT family N-acetyltransferase, partial [bacterium]|nr:GNAT family N-acetyltransferase [bacterium]